MASKGKGQSAHAAVPAEDYRVTTERCLNLGCGEDYQRGQDWINVDAVESVGPDLVCDLNEYPWPFADAQFHVVRASHVLEHLDDMERALQECARILSPGGSLEVRHPINQDFAADPDHNPANRWDWDTPLMFCGARHWDADLELSVTRRDVELWSQRPGWRGQVHQAWLDRTMEKYGPGRWCFDRGATSGQFIVEFRREPVYQQEGES